MRVLLLHPEDDPLSPLWAGQPWDRVIDLGFAGPETYERWSKSFACSLEPLPKLEVSDLQQVRSALLWAPGRMLDSQGLDWWELIALRFHEQLEMVISLQEFAASLQAGDELFFSRPCFQANTLRILLGKEIRCFPAHGLKHGKLRRLASAVSRLGLARLLDIAGDKYDAGYRVRRFIARSPKPGSGPMVLLPSAYVNVSRTALGYAAILPGRDFLLVTTRRSGWIAHPAENVRIETLSSYAPRSFGRREFEVLVHRWHELQKELFQVSTFSILSQAGVLDSVPRLLREGLMIRDAWLRVFNLEPVSSVLCADDSNPYTRIPLLIALKRNLAAVACHHGALDGRHAIKRSHAGAILAKGEMERDYLVGRCQLPEEWVEIGAPRCPAYSREMSVSRDAIIFFSEPYELSGGRCREFYREVVPRLAEVAKAKGCRLVIKLHPYESRRERQDLVRSVLPTEMQTEVTVVQGPLSEEQFRNVWFAVTVLSTAALDCALRHVPVFLCKWLDHSNYGYLEQFAKFGVGMQLQSADCIFKIPERLEDWSPVDRKQLWEPMSSFHLNSLLTMTQTTALAAAV